MTALVAAITAYSLTVERADADAQSFVRSLRESREAYQELTEAMEGEQASVTDTIRALQNLLANDNKTEAQKDVILRMVEELNQAVPELGLAYDKASDSINMTTDALEHMAKAAGDQEAYEAQVERLNELYTERESITNELADAQAQLDEAMANAQWDSFGGAMNDAAVDVEQLRNGVTELTTAQEENAEQIAAMEEATAAFSQRQEEAAAQSQEMAFRTEEMTSRMEGLIAEIETLEAAYNESYSAAMESINGQMGLFQEMDGSAKTSVDSLIDTLKGQVSYLETYGENIKKAMEMGVDEGLVKKLSDGSQESAQILDAIVKGGTEDIAALNEQLAKVEEGKKDFSTTVAEMETEFDKKMEALEKDMKDTIKNMDLKDDAYTAGWNNIQGLIDGTNDQKQSLIRKYAEMGRAALDAYKREVRQASPSKAFVETGRFDIQGIIKGAEEEKAALSATYAQMARTALESMERGLPSTFEEPRIAYNPVDQASDIAAAVRSALGNNTGPSASAADIAAAVREALAGVSVNMNQRKVGELITDWQDRNDKSRGV